MFPYRQTEKLHSQRVGCSLLALRAIRRELGKGDRVVDTGLDSTLAQERLKRVAPFAAHYIQMKDMPRPIASSRQCKSVDTAERTAIGAGNCNTPFRPLVEVPKFDVENGRLQAVEPGIPALEFVIVFRFAPVIGDHSAALGQAGIVCEDGATVAIGTKIFPGVEAEAADIAERADALPANFRTMRLRGVFDHSQIKFTRQRVDRCHVAGVAIQVYDYQSRGLSGDMPPHICEVNEIGLRIGCAENNFQSRTCNGFAAGDKAVGGNDDFAARRKAEGLECNFDGVRAVGDADAVGGALIAGKIFFKYLQMRAANKCRATDHIRNGGVDFGLDVAILRWQIEEFDGLRHGRGWHGGRGLSAHRREAPKGSNQLHRRVAA